MTPVILASVRNQQGAETGAGPQWRGRAQDTALLQA
jgi:hypothetical protein